MSKFNATIFLVVVLFAVAIPLAANFKFFVDLSQKEPLTMAAFLLVAFVVGLAAERSLGRGKRR